MPDAYVLVTPVRDEVATIGVTIASVVSQTRQPREWVIVDDGSTDGTTDVIAEAAARHPWIRPVRRPVRDTRDFAAVVHNTEIGIQALATNDFDYLGLLDADLRFSPDYFERLMRKFTANTRLGLAGGVVVDVGTTSGRSPRNKRDVPGAVQFFSTAGLKAAVPLIALPEGGWDCLTCVAVRAHGFDTLLCTDLVVDHLKPRNASQGGAFVRLSQLGVRDYALGYDPVFALTKYLLRMWHRPYLTGAVAMTLGFLTAMAARRPRATPASLVAQLRMEQRRRLWRLVGRGGPTNSPTFGELAL